MKMVLYASCLAVLMFGAADAMAADEPQTTTATTTGSFTFDIWCNGAKAVETTTQDGINADDAQWKLFEKLRASGKDNCWPIEKGSA